MSRTRLLAMCLVAACGNAAVAHAATATKTACSIEEVEKKVQALAGSTKKSDLRAIKQQCNWKVDASTCTFNSVIEMFLNGKASADVRSQCMR